MNATSIFSVQPLGDSAFIVEFADSSTQDALQRVHAAASALARLAPIGFIEAVPGFRSLVVHYDPLRVEWDTIRDSIEDCIAKTRSEKPRKGNAIVIPVCYDPEFAPDLDRISKHTGIAQDAIVELHSRGNYTVQLIGFAPGFCYLAGLPIELATPRQSVPRLRVPAGSVGIAQHQTGIYPIEIPGGWNLIGRTPIQLFRLDKEPPTAMQPGDQVTFERISRREFDAWNRNS